MALATETRTDTQIQSDVLAELKFEPRVQPELVLLWPYRSNQSSNAMVRTKAGESVDVHLVTLKNVLWGRREMSAILEKTDAVPVQR